MLGNNEKIQGVNTPELFAAMLSELPWRALNQYITGNAQLLKVCTFGGHRVDPNQRPRLEKQVINEAVKTEYSEATCNALFAAWYPVHAELHEKLETYFKSDEYKAYRTENKLSDENYILCTEKFDEFFSANELKAWKILLVFSPLKFTHEQADQILNHQASSPELLEQIASLEARLDAATKKAAAASADVEKARAAQQATENELRECKQQLRNAKSELDSVNQKLQSSSAETKRLSSLLATRSEELTKQAANANENAERTLNRLQAETARLKDELNAWQNKYQEQLLANRQIQNDAANTDTRAEKANAERDAAKAKLAESQKFVDLLLSRIEWAKLGSMLKLSPSLRKNFNSMLKRLNYEEDLSLTIEGTLTQFWGRLQKTETELIQKVANSNTLEVANGDMEGFWNEIKDSFTEVQTSLEARVFMLGFINELLFSIYAPEQLANAIIPPPASKKKSAE
ncbi:MAG: hypothetical protein MJ106_01515 [Lentisphaeria bacterium]|nr:hypothetical protein [Lentisphaeria bacterium]